MTFQLQCFIVFENGLVGLSFLDSVVCFLFFQNLQGRCLAYLKLCEAAIVGSIARAQGPLYQGKTIFCGAPAAFVEFYHVHFHTWATSSSSGTASVLYVLVHSKPSIDVLYGYGWENAPFAFVQPKTEVSAFCIPFFCSHMWSNEYQNFEENWVAGAVGLNSAPWRRLEYRRYVTFPILSSRGGPPGMLFCTLDSCDLWLLLLVCKHAARVHLVPVTFDCSIVLLVCFCWHSHDLTLHFLVGCRSLAFKGGLFRSVIIILVAWFERTELGQCFWHFYR